MNTVKTAVVVIILIGVLYGVYRVLNMPEDGEVPAELASLSQMAADINIGVPSAPPIDGAMTDPAAAGLEFPQPTAIDFPQEFEGLVRPPVQSEANLAAGSSTKQGVPSPHSGHDFGGAFQGQPTASDPPTTRNEVPFSSPPPTGFAPAGNNAQDLGPGQDIARAGLEKAFDDARQLIDDGRLSDALAELSLYYGQPDLSPDEQQRLQSWLDPLAGKVIYSSEHRIETSYIVSPGDKLEELAQEYQVPAQLLFNINREVISDSRLLVPRTELKVLRGPFQAFVDLDASRLTLFLGRLYAGQFQINVGDEPRPRSGKYVVKDKQPGRDFYPRNGQAIPAGNPDNPYGRFWIDLGGEVCIHAAGGSVNGCIGLSPQDAGDVYGILSRGSRVEIRR